MTREQLDLFIASDDLNLLKEKKQSVEDYEIEKEEAKDRLKALADWVMSD